MKRFHVNFEKPRAGWLPIAISGEGGKIDIVASYTPQDSFTDLVSSVLYLYRTGSMVEVIFNEEPVQRRLYLHKELNYLVVECSDADKREVIRANFDTGCREFSRKFKALLDNIGYDGFVTDWRHSPPKMEIQELWAYFSSKDQ